MSPDEREIQIFNVLQSASSIADLETPGSAQNEAANWLINLDSVYICPDDNTLVQRYVMAVFYYSTEGDDWARCNAPSNFTNPEAVDEANKNCFMAIRGNAWLTPGSECAWAGVICESTQMWRIDIERNQLAGTIPSEISHLTALQFLLLEEGLITGTIPTEIGNLDQLEQIDLNFNLIQGTIPEELYNLSYLQQLDLNDNELTGTISSLIGNLQMLSFLQIENNKFSGEIPSQMGDLTSLEVATMHENQLSGTMPESVCQNRDDMLVVLTTDCLGAPSRPSPPYVACSLSCCTQCF